MTIALQRHAPPTKNSRPLMKHPSTLCILALLSAIGIGCERASVATQTVPSSDSKTNMSVSPKAPKADVPPSAVAPSPADPFAPIRVANVEAIPPPADIFSNGMKIYASNSGPVNTEEPDRDFFTDPRLDQGQNSGRLFYRQFFLQNPHDPQIQERRVWFICWSPLNDGDRAQRLQNRDGFYIEEVTTDGKSLQVHHSAYQGSTNQVDTYRWSGDALGKGQFELEGSTSLLAGISTATPFEIERDRGYELLAERKWTEAVAAFERALTLQPGSAPAYFALGLVWEELALKEPTPAASKAIDAFGQALKADPQRTAVYRHRADLHLRLNQADLAIAELTQLIALEPDSWETLLQRATIHGKRAEYSKAIADAQQANEKAPIEEATWTALALYQYRGERFDDAIATGRRALAVDDSRTAIRVTLACAYARLGKLEEALKVYREAQANGVSSSERRWGIRELERSLKTTKSAPAKGAALQKLLEKLIGPDELRALDDDEE